MFVRSSPGAAGLVQYSVLLHRHTAEPLSSRFADKQFSPISTMVMVCCIDVILATVEVAIPKTRASTNCWVAHTLPFVVDRLGLYALSLMQCQRHLQISRVKNIDSVVELSGVAFRLAPSYGGLLIVN